MTEEVRNRINSRLNERYGSNAGGNRFYLEARDGQSAKVMELRRYVNPKLSLHSDFYRTLDAMMKCAEQNAHLPAAEAEAQQVCQHEFDNLQIAALENKTLFHHVNQRFFMKENLYRQGTMPR